MSDSDSWKIPASAEQCARCEAALEVGDQVTVFLRFGDDGPAREDLCIRCGQAVEVSGPDVFWRHTLPESAVASPVVDYALLREMFHRMLARPEPVYQRLSYLVGLVLVRKRHLRLRGFERRHGHEVMVVSKGAGEPDLEVPAPHLSAEALVETREQLTRLLAADLPSEDIEGMTDGETADLERGDAPAEDSSAEGLEQGEADEAVEAAESLEAPAERDAVAKRSAGKRKRAGKPARGAAVIKGAGDGERPEPGLN